MDEEIFTLKVESKMDHIAFAMQRDECCMTSIIQAIKRLPIESDLTETRIDYTCICDTKYSVSMAVS